MEEELKICLEQEDHRMLMEFCHNKHRWTTKECKGRQKKKFEKLVSGRNIMHKVKNRRQASQNERQEKTIQKDVTETQSWVKNVSSKALSQDQISILNKG